MEDTIAEVPDEHGEFVVGDGVGHYPMLEDLQGVTDVSLQFLEEKGIK